MNASKRILGFALAACLIASSGPALSHGDGTPGTAPEGMIVTRHFTGIWDQPEHEAQGIALQVVEQLDDSRRAVGYWYTYGADRETAWYMGVGELVDNRIEFELYDSTGVGFLEPALPGNDSVVSIGTMTIEFDSCQSGQVTFDTTDEDVGSGSFAIERILEVMNTHCTGGISDDMHADGLFGEQRLALTPARENVNAEGFVRFESYPAHMALEVEVEGLADGIYALHVGGEVRGEIEVMNGQGEIRFSSPEEDGYRFMNFDPRGMQIELYDGQGVVLSSFDRRLRGDDHVHQGYGGGHAYGCGDGHMGGGMGGGMGGHRDCVEDGDYVEIEIELQDTGILAGAEGEAEWQMNAQRVRFSVEIQDVPAGWYTLHVGGAEVGVFEAFEMHYGDVYGRISFQDPEVSGRAPLDFEPRGEKIEVIRDGDVILEAEFPVE